MKKKKEKKMPFFQVKELLGELGSADLELVIFEAAHYLKIESFREAERTLKMTTNRGVVLYFKDDDGDIKHIKELFKKGEK